MTPWQTLGVGQDIGVADLRRRYAVLIKQFRPETHPQDFARIRAAYEVALPFARQRELAAAEEPPALVDAAVDGPPPADAPPDAIDDLPPRPPADPFPAARQEAPGFEAELAIGDEAIGTLIEAGELRVEGASEESSLAAHFRRFHAAAESAAGTRDESWLPELRALLQARARASLDDGQALEFALMRWFIEAEMPPLTLLFEAGRVFDWHLHVVRLSSWLSPWALRQMEMRLAMSRDLVYARHFSGNRWLRRLHSTQPVRIPVAFWPSALEAMRWAHRWQAASEAADVPGLASSLNPRTMERLHGLSSTDLLVGLAVAATQPTVATAAAWGLGAAALVSGSRFARRRIEEMPPGRRLRRWVETNSEHRFLGALFAIGAGAFGAMVLVLPEPNAAEIALSVVLLAPLAWLAAGLAWRIAALVELVAAWPFHWREAVDRLEFDRYVGSRAAPEPGRPFGSRLGGVQRLRSIGAALRFQDEEIVRRARPARARPFTLVRFSRAGVKGNPWRLLWFAAWILFAAMRVWQTFAH